MRGAPQVHGRGLSKSKVEWRNNESRVAFRNRPGCKHWVAAHTSLTNDLDQVLQRLDVGHKSQRKEFEGFLASPWKVRQEAFRWLPGIAATHRKMPRKSGNGRRPCEMLG